MSIFTVDQKLYPLQVFKFLMKNFRFKDFSCHKKYARIYVVFKILLWDPSLGSKTIAVDFFWRETELELAVVGCTEMV